MNWNAEADQIIIDNRNTINAAGIAKLIGHGLTRNAIIGRARRLGLPNIQTRRPHRPRRVNGEAKVRKAPAKVFVSPPVPVVPLNVLFIDLERHHCREIVGSAGAGMSLSCGHPVITESSYCRWHHAINYTTPAARTVSYVRAA